MTLSCEIGNLLCSLGNMISVRVNWDVPFRVSKDRVAKEDGHELR